MKNIANQPQRASTRNKKTGPTDQTGSFEFAIGDGMTAPFKQFLELYAKLLVERER